jgi:CheY-like chemotaxis protein
MPAEPNNPIHPATGKVADVLPYLRRHARALTGSQQIGDSYAAATLEALLADPEGLRSQTRTDVAVFRAFYGIWQSSGAQLEESERDATGARAQAMRHLSRLTPQTREALLLHTVEGFTLQDVGAIMGVSAEEAGQLVEVARKEMHEAVRGRIMVIEDESIIAMDLEAIVQDLGHEVVGVAATREHAVDMGLETAPDLVLADIQLADDSSGIDAVNELLDKFPDMPVIFITAFPERLLTGERPEPSFLIAKPFTPPQVISAVSQAMFFSSTETLRA